MEQIVAELVKVFPQNDWVKAFLFVFLALLVVLREKLFVKSGEGLRYSVRWFKCKILQKHTYRRSAGFVDMSTLIGDFYFECIVCGYTRLGRSSL